MNMKVLILKYVKISKFSKMKLDSSQALNLKNSYKNFLQNEKLKSQNTVRR